MFAFLHQSALAFIPLFVAIDAVGLIPFYLALTANLDAERRRVFLRQALLTALAVALGFSVGGRLLFRLLGITADDFRVAGGVLLLGMSIADILFAAVTERRQADPGSGGVPLGVPLIVGPAALTTLLMLTDNYAYHVTATALLANLGLAWLFLSFAEPLTALLRPAGVKACSKVAALFLAAIAIMMIRQGVVGLIHLHFPGAGR